MNPSYTAFLTALKDVKRFRDAAAAAAARKAIEGLLTSNQIDGETYQWMVFAIEAAIAAEIPTSEDL